MKYIFISLISLVGLIGFAQPTPPTIDSSNYYSYFSDGEGLQTSVTTHWLQLNDVVPILLEEMKIAEYDRLYDYCLFRTDSNKYVILAAYSGKSNVGFLFNEGHSAFPVLRHRQDMIKKNLNGTASFSYALYRANGEVEFDRIKQVPRNIIVLDENCYWYQFADKVQNEQHFVTRAIAEQTFREDVRSFLKRFNPVK